MRTLRHGLLASVALTVAPVACGSSSEATSSGPGGSGGAPASSVTGTGSGGGGGAGAGSGSGGAGGSEPVLVRATNPVLGPDRPDPHVLRTIAADGKPLYYLTATVGGAGDFPVLTSRDLVTWTPEPQGLFHKSAAPGGSLALNGSHFCAMWAPEIVELEPSSYMLSFTATRFAQAQAPCPPYKEDSGVYLAWSSSPTGPFALAAHPWEPVPAGAHEASCPPAIRLAVPRSLDYASPGCQGTFCHHIIRLDSSVFRDPATGRSFLAYSWYTNSPPLVAWEHNNHGEHVHLVELDPADPFAVRCDANVAQIHVANPHDGAMLQKLESSCDRCGEMLSMTRGRLDENMMRDGYSWGVAEGASLFRRGEYVYMLASGSAWDSAYYHVFWVAAKTVEGLSVDNPNRLVGRYLVPSEGQAFGHGTAVLGPDGESHYFVHHRLVHAPCKQSGSCARDVWVSPIEFEDRGDGLGPVHIKARFPAEEPDVSVLVP